jgi:hypothetical protein
MGKHALLSPSGFKAIMLCPAKPAMEHGRVEESNEYAGEGSAAHFLGAWCLSEGLNTDAFVGERIVVGPAGEAFETVDGPGGNPVFEVTDDMADHVQTYIDTVRDYVGPDGELFVEQALPIDHITGEEGAEGTGDTVILRGDEIIVIDLKFGRGVEVQADDNPQLKLYALGALRKFDLVGDIRRARMVICQPRAGGTTEAVCTVEELQAWGSEKAMPAAQLATKVYGLPLWPQSGQESPGDYCRPHEDACRFCKAKAECGALANTVQTAMQREFTDLTTADEPEREAIVETSVATADAAGDLGARMDAVPLVEMWCKAIRGRVEKRLLEGRPVAGYKLVEGKRGNRQWSDETEAEKVLKGMRLKKEQMYSFKVITPTAAEKLLKPTPKRWAKAQALITQSDGKPSVAPIADKRPALQVQPLESEFTPITEEAPATADDLV